MGRLWSSQKQFGEAIKEHGAAVDLARQIGERLVEAVSLLNIGRAYADSGQVDAARESFRQGLALVTSVGDKTMETVGLHGLAECALMQGELATARENIERALEIVESGRVQIGSHELRSAYSASVYQFYALYVDVLMVLSRDPSTEGLAELALRTNERLKARSLVEMLTDAEQDATTDSEPRGKSLINSIKAKLEELSEQRSHAGLANAQVAGQEALRDLIATETEYDRALQQLSESRDSFESKYPTPLSLNEIREQVLDDESIILSFMFNERKGHLWLATKETLRSFELPDRRQIEGYVSRAYKCLTARNVYRAGEVRAERNARIASADLEFVGAGNKLSELVLAPVRRYLDKKRLLIVADGALLHLPIGILPLPGCEGEYVPVVRDYEVVVLPSASLIGHFRAQPTCEKSPSTRIAVFADPVFSADDTRMLTTNATAKTVSRAPRFDVDNDEIIGALRTAAAQRTGRGAQSLPRLPGTRTEASAICALASGSNTVTALDFDACLTRALDTDVADSQILHFATHGFLDDEHASLSGIVLSLVRKDGSPQSGFLSSSHLVSRRFNSQLAVLSACRTGMGREVTGDGVLGLPRAFMFSGVHRLVVTMWAVDDLATSQFMTSFYRELLGSRWASPASALRNAQLMMMSSEFGSPYFWGAFSFCGDWKSFRLSEATTEPPSVPPS